MGKVSYRIKNVGVRFSLEEHAAIQSFAVKVSWTSQPLPLGQVVRTLALERLKQLEKKPRKFM
jgi:hypothetical protein